MHVGVNLYRYFCFFSISFMFSHFYHFHFKSYSYFDSSNIHTHAAIHITFHFLCPCCQYYLLEVQSLIFTQLLQRTLHGVSSSLHIQRHAIKQTGWGWTFVVTMCASADDRMKMAEKLNCHAVSLKAHAIFYILFFPKKNIGLRIKSCTHNSTIIILNQYKAFGI